QGFWASECVSDRLRRSHRVARVFVPVALARRRIWGWRIRISRTRSLFFLFNFIQRATIGGRFASFFKRVFVRVGLVLINHQCHLKKKIPTAAIRIVLATAAYKPAATSSNIIPSPDSRASRRRTG